MSRASDQLNDILADCEHSDRYGRATDKDLEQWFDDYGYTSFPDDDDDDWQRHLENEWAKSAKAHQLPIDENDNIPF